MKINPLFSFDVNARKRSRYLINTRVPSRLAHWGFSSQPGLRHTCIPFSSYFILLWIRLVLFFSKKKKPDKRLVMSDLAISWAKLRFKRRGKSYVNYSY